MSPTIFARIYLNLRRILVSRLVKCDVDVTQHLAIFSPKFCMYPSSTTFLVKLLPFFAS